MNIHDVQNPETWLALAAGLHIGGNFVRQAVRAFHPGDVQLADLDGRLREDGYFRLAHEFGLDLAVMADSVRRFSAAGIPPVFCFLFDEFWAPFHALDAMYGGLLGPYGLLPGLLGVECRSSPRRLGLETRIATEAMPRCALTVDRFHSPPGLPLSDATPLNSCMYIVPAHADPTYGTPHENEFPLRPARHPRPAGRNRARFSSGTKPCCIGAGRSSHRATESRVSMAFEFQASGHKAFQHARSAIERARWYRSIYASA